MLTESEHQRIAEAIRHAEVGTSGEIVCVLAHASSDYSVVPVLWAALVALVSPWPMVLFTTYSVMLIFSLQIAIFIAAAALFSLPGVRMWLVPAPVMKVRAHRAAMEQFFARGLTRARGRRGLMIFVSHAERYARIVTDDGIAEIVKDDEWRPALDALVAEIRKGRVAEGYIAAVGRCGEILARHFPPTDEPDRLPDKLYIV